MFELKKKPNHYFGREERMDLDWGMKYEDELRLAAAIEEGAAARVKRTRRMLNSPPPEWSGQRRPAGMIAGEQPSGNRTAGRRIGEGDGCVGRVRHRQEGSRAGRMQRASERDTDAARD
ncbi:hypothetical protein E2562_012053 [Oryza meyeriana var. granulata]|uniref:Uncharacterized protein n=1 Tax=Oryza meyeriana var. granulata TaxID=110450 RepID=A0A6G1D4G1_9ORYZ|nr:hypothetical protein E2562_012053 [Oryza meyeriana var. granulata]